MSTFDVLNARISSFQELYYAFKVWNLTSII